MNPQVLKEIGSYREGPARSLGSAYAGVGSETRKTLRRMIPLTRAELETELPDEPSWVTRKFNGELGVLVYRDDAAILINSNNTARAGLPVVDEAQTLLRKAGLKDGCFSCELYAQVDGHETVAAVQKSLAENPETLHLAVFDIQTIDGSAPGGGYGSRHNRITEIFGEGTLITSVEMTRAESRDDVLAAYDEIVTRRGAEGLVIRASGGLVYKVKPEFSLDCAVLGFTSRVGSKGEEIRNLLFGLQEQEGTYRVIGHGGNGLSTQDRQTLHHELLAQAVDSDYLRADGEGLAFRMVNPTVVVEVTCQDINNDSISGPIENPLIRCENSDNSPQRWQQVDAVHGVSLTHPVIRQLRRDKSAAGEDVRLAQIDIHLPQAHSSIPIATPSTVLSREVYTKRSKDKLMVRKFLTYQTNKGDGTRFLDCFFFYTDFSSSRKEPLKTEIRTSNSIEQIESICADYKAKNIKKGWELQDA